MVNRVIKLEGRGLRGESYADTARRSGLFGILPTDDDEAVIGKINADAAASADRAEMAAEQAADLVLPENRFVAADLATARSDGETATTADTYFIAVGEAEGEAEVRLRTAGGSDLIYTEITKSGLASSDPGKGAALVGVSPSETAADVFAQEVRVTTFGAKFDVGEVADIADATDDTDAWEAALAYLASIGGGTLRLPPGGSKVTRQIDIPVHVPIRIVGCGNRKLYPGKFLAGTPCPSTVVPVHTGRGAFRFFASADGHGSFCAEDFSLATLEEGDMPTAGFGWETQGGFLYGFTFRQVSIHGFTSAFDVYKNGGAEAAVGTVLIEKCHINRNDWIARTLNSTQFNGFWFYGNEAGQNGNSPGKGGISISGHAISIESNVLEGQRDPVYIFGGYRNIIIKGNYFEANTGDACVKLSDVLGPFDIGPNMYLGMNYSNIKQKVILRYTGIGTCLDPYWPEGTHKMAPALLGTSPENTLSNLAGSDDFGFYRLDRLEDANYLVKPNALASQGARVPIAGREQSPVTGLPMPISSYTTTGSGIATSTRTLSGAVGQWALASVLFKRVPDGGAIQNPVMTLNVNNTSDAGTRSHIAFNFNRYFQDDEWVLFTAAIKLGSAMTSLGIYFYPYGINPTAGRTARFLLPYACVLDDINKARPYIDRFLAHSVTAAPTAGTWQTGDKLDGHDGKTYVCTAAGTPGTWGTITPS